MDVPAEILIDWGVTRMDSYHRRFSERRQWAYQTWSTATTTWPQTATTWPPQQSPWTVQSLQNQIVQQQNLHQRYNYSNPFLTKPKK